MLLVEVVVQVGVLVVAAKNKIPPGLESAGKDRCFTTVVRRLLLLHQDEPYLLGVMIVRIWLQARRLKISISSSITGR